MGKLRTFNCEDGVWKGLLQVAKELGYEDRSALIRAIGQGEVLCTHPIRSPLRDKLPLPEEEAPSADDLTYDKTFDWGA